MFSSVTQDSPAGAPRTWRWALAGTVLGLVLALLLAAPARWLQPLVADASGGHLRLADAQGTVWRGSAQLQLSGGTGSQDRSSLPTRLHWALRLRPTHLQLELASDCCTSQPLVLDWQPGWNGGELRLAAGESRWPASLLAGLGTPWNTVQLQGSLHLRCQGLRLQQAQGRSLLEGAMTLTAEDLASRLSTLPVLGSYRLQLQADGTPRLQLETLKGGLQLQGEGQWVQGRLHFQGLAWAAPGQEAALANLLNILGRRDGARSLITLG